MIYDHSAPLAIDLYCGLGGWTAGLLAEGYRVVGFDNERHAYGDHRYPAQLVLQDVLTLHGSQFRDAALIVASPPCQAYSYRAMPWKRAKALPPPDNSLFEACFRIQREAIEAAGRHIPLVVENVVGAQKWVGRARWHYGSFYLWGDVPALMPIRAAHKVSGFRFDGSGTSFQTASVERSGVKVGGLNWSKHGEPGYSSGPGRCFRDSAIKNEGGLWFRVAHNTTSGKGRNPVEKPLLHSPHFTNPAEHGVKHHGSGAVWFDTGPASLPSKSPKRKAASAMIAKIPFELARYIAAYWKPEPLAMRAG